MPGRLSTNPFFLNFTSSLLMLFFVQLLSGNSTVEHCNLYIQTEFKILSSLLNVGMSTGTAPLNLSHFRRCNLGRIFKQVQEVKLSAIFLSLRFGRWLLASGQDGCADVCADEQVLILAGIQHRCSIDRTDALKVCLCCVGIFDWKD